MSEKGTYSDGAKKRIEKYRQSRHLVQVRFKTSTYEDIIAPALKTAGMSKSAFLKAAAVEKILNDGLADENSLTAGSSETSEENQEGGEDNG